MKHFYTKIIALALITVLALGVFAGCSNSSSDENGTATIKVGANITPHSEILEQGFLSSRR